LKIAVATWSYDEHQGISRCVVELTARLAQTHEVHVFAAEQATEARPGVHLHRVDLRYPRPHINDYDFFFRAGRALRAGNFDLVHAHFPVWCPTDVYTCHGLARMALRSWRRFPPDARVDVPTLRMLRWYVQIPIHSYAVRQRRPLLAAVSNKVARELAEETGRPLERITVVPNGVDLDRFNPAARDALRTEARTALGIGDDRFVLLWVGNHLRHKGIRHTLAVLDRLPERAMLCVVGGDDPRNVPEAAQSIERLQAQGRLTFCKADLKIERYYAAADALLFPSLYESFGLVVLEAMAMGVPTVTPRTVGFADEAVTDGVNGMLVDVPWDIDGMARRTLVLMQDGAVAQAMSLAGIETARHYTWNAYCSMHEALYASAIKSRDARQGRIHAT
jgi:UDP-glucose:(heptosyl)LPS alpha-1,3-glucosyltransferase